MNFYRQSSLFDPCYETCDQPYYRPRYLPRFLPSYQPYCPEYSCPIGYSRGVSVYEPCNSYGGYGYGYGYGNQSSLNYGCGPGYGYGYGYGSPCLPPCSYGYHYSNRGSCYNPRKFRCGYGARRDLASRAYGYYGGCNRGCYGGYCGPL